MTNTAIGEALLKALSDAETCDWCQNDGVYVDADGYAQDCPDGCKRDNE